MPSPSLIEAVALNSPAMPAFVIRKRPLPCVIETPTSPAPRKSVTFAAAMRMIGASSEVLRTLSAPAPSTRSNANVPPSCWPAISIRSVPDVPTSTRSVVGVIFSAKSIAGSLMTLSSRPSSATVAASSPVRPAGPTTKDAVPFWVDAEAEAAGRRVAEEECDVGEAERERRGLLLEGEVAFERLAGDRQLDGRAADRQLLRAVARVDGELERALERDARDRQADLRRSGRRSSRRRRA